MSFVLAGGIGQLKPSAGFSVWSTVSSTTPPGWSATLAPTFSNSNRGVVSSDVSGRTPVDVTNSGPARTTGRLYFEITNNAVLADAVTLYIGVTNNTSAVGIPGANFQSNSLTPQYGASNSWGTYSGGALTGVAFTAPGTNTDRIGVAVDMVTNAGQGNIFYRSNGLWLNQGSPQSTFPAATSYDGTVVTSGGFFILCQTLTNNVMTINTGQVAFVDAPPSGYVAWG